MKKYIAIGIIGLIMLSVGVFFGFKYKFAYSSNILNYIPENFGQVFYVSVDTDLENLLKDNSVNVISGDYKDVLLQIDQIAAYQYISGTQVNSFVVAKVKKDFDFNKAVSVGFIQTGENYTYKALDGNIFVYGEKSQVDYLSSYKGPKIGDNKQLESYINDITSNNSNIGFFSTIDSTDVELGTDMFSQYLKQMKYGALVAHIGKEKNEGQFNAIFNTNLEFLKDYKFSNTLANYSSKDDAMFLQIGNILSMLGISQQQLDALITTIPAFEFASEDDKEKLYRSLNGNIAAVIGNSDNPFGVGAGIIFQSEDVYSLISKYFPFVKDFVLSNQYLSGYTTVLNETQKLGFNVAVPFGLGSFSGNTYVSKINNNTILNIFDSKIGESKDKVDFQYSDKTILNFYLNFGKLINLYTKFGGVMGGDVVSIQKLEYLKDKNLRGDISFYGDKATLKFKLTK